jgi:hypothetical protein
MGRLMTTPTLSKHVLDGTFRLNPDSEGGRYERLVRNLLGAQVSRRTMFSLAAAASGALPIFGSVARAAAAFKLIYRDGIAIFTVEDIPVWTIDPARFDGDPQLSLTQSASEIQIRLEHAWYPGSAIRADLRCEIRREPHGWMGQFHLPGVALDTQVAFSDWLVGYAQLSGKTELPIEWARYSSPGYECSGAAVAAFHPDWTINLRNCSHAVALFGGQRISLNELAVTLPEPTTESLFEGPPKRRTRVLLRTAEKWKPHTFGLGPAELTLGSRPDAMVVEFSPGSRGTAAAAYIEAANPDRRHLIRLHLLPPESRVDKLQVLPARVRLADYSIDNGSRLHLFATLERAAHWVSLGVARAEVVASEGESALHISRCADQAVVHRSGHEIARFVIALPGVDRAIFARRPKAPPVEGKDSGGCLTGVEELNGSTQQLSDPFWSRRRINLDEFDLHLIRTLDALSCVARFRNLDLVHTLWGWRIVARDVAHADEQGNALIEFDLGSQHLQEHAELNAQGGDTYKVKTVPPSPVAPTPTPAPAPLRVRAMEAGHSRLLFALCGPAGDRPTLRFTLEHLLDWRDTAELIQRRKADDWGWLRAVPIPWALPPDASMAEQLQAATEQQAKTNKGQPRRWKKPVGLDQIPGDSSVWGTSLEIPFRLSVCPVAPRAQRVGWENNIVPHLDSSGGVELWSTKLNGALLRAAYSPSLKLSDKGEFWQAPVVEPEWSLDAFDRHNITALTSGFGQLALLGRGSVVPFAPTTQSALQNPDPESNGLFIPSPFRSSRLLLTSLGATFTFRGLWEPPAAPRVSGSCGGALTVRAWSHDAILRRDRKVVVEYEGFLWPLGHPAVLIKETERKFEKEAARRDGLVAKLKQRYYIRIDPYTRAFPAARQPYNSLDLPHRSLQMDRWDTPDLVNPATEPASIRKIVEDLNAAAAATASGPSCQAIEACAGIQFNGYAFWPLVAGDPSDPNNQAANQLVAFEFYDSEANVHYRAPLIFVDNDLAHTPSFLAGLRAYYCGPLGAAGAPPAPPVAGGAPVSAIPTPPVLAPYLSGTPAWGASSVPQAGVAVVTGGKIPYAASASGGNTSYPTEAIVLGASFPLADPSATDPCDYLRFTRTMEAGKQPPFYPSIRRAKIQSSSLGALSGNPANWFYLEYHPHYVLNGFDPGVNPGEVFLRFADAGARIDFSRNSAASGGVANPTTTIVALSRRHGPVGGRLPAPSSLGTYQDMLAAAAIKQGITLEALTAQAAPPEDPVASVISGGADPMEYFGQALGDAKLLGIVRLVDIVKAVVKASGAQLPKILQTDLYGQVLDQLKPLVDAVAAPIGSLTTTLDTLESDPGSLLRTAVAKLRPPLNHIIGAVSQLRDGLAKKAPIDEMLKIVGQIGSGAKELESVVAAISADPAQILPPEWQEMLGTAKQIYSVLWDLYSGHGFAEQLRTWAQRQAESLAAQSLSDLTAAVTSSSEYRAVAEEVANLRQTFEALRQSVIETASKSLSGVLAGAFAALQSYVGSLDDLRAWADIVAGNVSDLRALLDQCVTDLAAAVKSSGQIPSASDNVVALVQRVQGELAKIPTTVRDTAVSELAVVLGQLANQFAARSAALDTRRAALAKSPAPKAAGTATQSEDVEAIVLSYINGPLEQWRGAWASLGRGIQLLDKVQTLLNAADPGDALHLKDSFTNLKKPLTDAANTWAQALLAIGNAPAAKFQAALAKIDLSARPYLKGITTELSGWASLLQLKPSDLFPASFDPPKINAADAQVLSTVSAVLSGVSDPDPQSKLRQLARRVSGDLAHALDDPQIRSLIGGALTALVTAVKAAAKQLDTLQQQVTSGPLKRWLPASLLNGLTALGNSLNKLANLASSLLAGDPLNLVRADVGQRVLQALHQVQDSTLELGRSLEVGQLLKDEIRQQLQAAVQELLTHVGLPTRIRTSYEWDTAVGAFPDGAEAIFKPRETGGKRLTINALVEADLLGGSAPTASIKGVLDPFQILLFGSAASILTLNFKALTFSAGAGSPASMDVQFDNVELGSDLAFVKLLQKWLSPKKGVFVRPAATGLGLEVGYAFPATKINIGPMALQNIGFIISAVLPFDNRPAQFIFKLSEPRNPFLLSVGIYGGGGYVGVSARPDGLEYFEASFEYGLVTAFNFGPASGQGRITAGVYLRLSGSGVTLSGFFNASGAADIAGLITISAAFRVELGYDSGTGSAYGDATFEVDFTIAIVSYGFSVEVGYRQAGSPKQSQSAGAQSASLIGAVVEMLPGRAALAGEPHDESPRATNDSVQQADARATRTLDPHVWQNYWSAFPLVAVECQE